MECFVGVRRLSKSGPGLLVAAIRRRAAADGVGPQSAGLAYYTFLSLFPLLLLALSAIGFLLSGSPDAQRDWVERLTGSIPGLGPLVGRNLRAVVDGRAAAGVLGLVGAAWAGSGVALAAQDALGRIFRTPSRGTVRRRIRSLSTMAGLGMLSLSSVALTGAAAGLFGDGAADIPFRVLGVATGLGVDLLLFLLAYLALTPPGGPPLRVHVPGAWLMAGGWTLLKVAGSLYTVRVVARLTALYGTVGAVFGLLAVLHVGTRLFLYGAELSAVLSERRAGRAPQ